MSIVCPAELRRKYLAGAVLPFIGAGVSMAVQWLGEQGLKHGPSWGELVDEAARKLGFQRPDLLRVRGTDLQILEYFRIRQQGSFAALTNWLIKEMSPPDSALKESLIHCELASLENCRLFYTTNFDDLLERAFRVHGRTYRRVAVEAHMYGHTDAKTCEIVKFHGDLEYPDRMVLSESDYQYRLTLQSDMDYRLRADMLGRVVLFLGYSFRDWNVSYLFRLMNLQFHNQPGSLTGRRGYITVPDPSDFEINLFDQRNIEVIPIDGRYHTEDIASLLNSMRNDE